MPTDFNGFDALGEASRGGYKVISPPQLKKALAVQDVELVSVLPQSDEVIPGTDHVLDLEEIPDNLDLFPDRTAPTILYCGRGSLSRSAAEKLVELGFTQVVWLNGGMRAWERAGYELEKR
jgi:rhodanese-related sulfurtransferase